jgi:ribosomal protection tetracycline resistance protein
MNKPKISIGILAHVDAGKTSVTEQLLFQAGATKNLGSVDSGTAQTDRLAVEKSRGISVQSAYTSMEFDNTDIFLIDTPGHVDFSAEVERVLSVIDMAVLVISAVEGIQAHTETIWKVLQQSGIPVVLFINKTDRIGADSEMVVGEFERQFNSQLALLNKIAGEGSSEVSAQLLWTNQRMCDQIIESLANVNDEVLEAFLAGDSKDFEWYNNQLIKTFWEVQIFPTILGSAKTGLGIDLLLQTITGLIKEGQNEDKLFSARVFGLSNETGQGQITYAKMLQGKLEPRNVVKNNAVNVEEKVTLLKQFRGGDEIDLKVATAGDIVNIYGLKEFEIGQVLGEIPADDDPLFKLQSPLLTVQVKPVQEKDYAALAEAMQILNKENPELDFEWLKEDKELHVKVMGWIQMEVLTSILQDRFNIEAQFDDPTVIFKETPASVGFGYAKYTMPKPCWAIVKFKIEPGEPGSGVEYKSEVSVDKIHRKYQNEVERTIPQALKQGIKGWEVTDLKITLIDGEDHEIHSRPGDFIIVTPMGIMEGLKEIGTTLLEPVLEFKITASEDLLGAITSDITQMRGSFDSPEMGNGKFTLTGFLPLATSLEYPIQLSSRSGGKAKISTRLHSYKPCADEQGETRSFKGISPLDRSKYILKMRKAIQ